VNGKKAKLLRKLTEFDPNKPREYEKLPMGKKRKLLITEEGFKEEFVDKVMVIADERRRKYKIAKSLYKAQLKGDK